MQEKQFGHSAVTSAGTPPFICWEVCVRSLKTCLSIFWRLHAPGTAKIGRNHGVIAMSLLLTRITLA